MVTETFKTHLPKNILITRFSSLGDVAMTIPVIKEFLEQNPQVKATILTRDNFKTLFEDIPNLTFIAADLDNDYKGVLGLYRLYKELKAHRFDAWTDLHNVLRTKILALFFTFDRIKIKHLKKGRKEKKKLTQQTDKKLLQLTTTFQRYAEVFKALGFSVELSNQSPIKQEINNTTKKIGIAPFAKFKEKMYPLQKMEQVVSQLNQKGYEIQLFGGGKVEETLLNHWQEKYKNAQSFAGKITMREELVLMQNLNLMLSMDSANMHLAALVGTKVISIWGATHPFAGFLGYGQSSSNVIELDLACRPCSVFGNKECYRKDLACMNIAPEVIVQKIIELA